nr:MAG TPA: hypothetical protein [Caudoviricetes sp.]
MFKRMKSPHYYHQLPLTITKNNTTNNKSKYNNTNNNLNKYYKINTSTNTF